MLRLEIDMSNNVSLTTVIDNAVFEPLPLISTGETINGTLSAVYNSTGTLISETGTIVMTETAAVGGAVLHETFAIGGLIGSINPLADSAGTYEVTLLPTGEQGLGQVYPDLVLAWNGETPTSLAGGDSLLNLLDESYLGTQPLASGGTVTTINTNPMSGGSPTSGGSSGGGATSGGSTNSGSHPVPANSATPVYYESAGSTTYLGSSTNGYIVTGGGTEVVTSGGTTTGTIVDGGNSELVQSSGTTTGTVVNAGATLSVTVSGLVSSTQDSGQETISGNGSTASSAIGSGSFVLSGGTETLEADGVEIGGTVTSGGVLFVASGGTSIGETIEGGGTGVVFAGSTDYAPTVSSGGVYTISSGGAVYGLTSSTGANVNNTPDYYVSGGYISGLGSSTVNFQVPAGGTEFAGSGGTTTGTVIAAGGTLSVTVSGYASATQDSGQETISGNGSTASSAIGSGSVVMSGGTETLIADGVELGGTVLSGGVVDVASGGAVSGLVVDNGGSVYYTPVYLSSGGVVSGLGNATTGTVVSSGAALYDTNSGNTIGAVLLSGGSELVTTGGAANGTLVGSGATQIVAAGGIAANTVISGGTDILQAASNDGPVTFAGNGGTLVFDGAGTPSTQYFSVSGFVSGSGDAIVLSGLAYISGASAVLSGGQITITDGGSTYTIADPNDPAGTPFSTVNDGGVVELLIPCYANGTHILTTEGERLVEDIAVGDTVVTVRDGGPATAKVVWTGRRTIDILRYNKPEIVRPVRILAGAFGNNTPERDLRLSPHHAVYIDGALFEAVALINGITVIQEQTTRFVTYHHIELEQHDIMLAEGLPAESFLDTGNRDMFENTTGALQLHPDFRHPEAAPTCAPLHRTGPEVAAVHARLAAIAEAMTGCRAA
jgi:autotransporter passenger strand-loop-strand repeat protein